MNVPLLVELRGAAVRTVPLLLLALLAGAWLGAGIFARLLRRWSAARGSAEAGALERTATGSLRLLLVLLGLDWASTFLPLPPRLEVALSGALYVASILLAARLCMRLTAIAVQGYLGRAADPAARERAQKEYLPLASTITTLAVGMVAAILIAHHFGHDVSSLVAALGIGSLAIGLAAQQTLGNMIAGFTLLIDRPFRPGDRVRLATGEAGVVADIGIRSTRILLDEDNLLIVPNAELANTRVVNYAYPTPTARGEVRLRVTWALAERTLALGAELARAQPEVLASPPAEAVVAALPAGASDSAGAEVAVRFFVGEGAVVTAVEERLRLELTQRLLAGRDGAGVAAE